MFIIIEFPQLLIMTMTPLSYGQKQSVSLFSELKRLVYMYCELSSLHGIVFITLASTKPGIMFWACLVLGTFVIGGFFASKARFEMDNNPYLTTRHFFQLNVSSLQYPTITICPVQMSDRYNFQRLVLNRAKLVDKNANEISTERFKFIPKFLAEDHWLSDEAVDSLFNDENLDKDTVLNLVCSVDQSCSFRLADKKINVSLTATTHV